MKATKPIPDLTEKDKARFWAKVNKSGPVIREQLGPCWVWTAALSKAGYGVFGIGQGIFYASRISWTMVNGQITPGHETLHECDNPPCCNPNHIRTGTHAQNMRDMGDKNRHAWATHPERMARGDASGARKHPEKVERGEDRYNAKMTDEKVRQMRSDNSSGMSWERCARKYGISKRVAGFIITRQAWKHVV